MSPKGVKRTNLIFTERFEPDPRRVEEGLAILGRLIAQAYARDAPSNGHVPSADDDGTPGVEKGLGEVQKLHNPAERTARRRIDVTQELPAQPENLHLHGEI